jgi:DNA-binding IclR family transcriptional regulator
MDAPGMSDSAVPISQLAAHTSSRTDHLYRLLRYLAQFGIFEELPDQHFKLTPMGQYLRSDHPSGLCYAAVAFGAPGRYTHALDVPGQGSQRRQVRQRFLQAVLQRVQAMHGEVPARPQHTAFGTDALPWLLHFQYKTAPAGQCSTPS